MSRVQVPESPCFNNRGEKQAFSRGLLLSFLIAHSAILSCSEYYTIITHLKINFVFYKAILNCSGLVSRAFSKVFNAMRFCAGLMSV